MEQGIPHSLYVFSNVQRSSWHDMQFSWHSSTLNILFATLLTLHIIYWLFEFQKVWDIQLVTEAVTVGVQTNVYRNMYYNLILLILTEKCS